MIHCITRYVSMVGEIVVGLIQQRLYCLVRRLGHELNSIELVTM